ncbi:hypothetical protein CONCODRAFT_79858 [Conidiobolus coronatus NRRL 28638]|uniref:Pentacotripeptide-repeat region of PRORP domain-containing protein n=1 Tax=Conidiobolus coronatus (strain ATCC 28846 / CBS 209.66 / NRRL 28638) TaxID=796925 RepID=A0A137NZZ6_CONC2|nr:hypothetical protein CONCODRAFT_79858 [Conidiobolus coronatus NRRL 28638]|eukprot:KXN68179.1 hypothetical protein CONCODRAFT_79858 [Conidiobolus coronatus NRRL 28638]
MIKSFNKKRYNAKYCTLFAHKLQTLYLLPQITINHTHLNNSLRSNTFSSVSYFSSSHSAINLKIDSSSDESEVFSNIKNAIKNRNLDEVIESYNSIPEDLLRKIPKYLFSEILNLVKNSRSSQKSKYILRALKDTKRFNLGLEEEAYNALAFSMASSKQYEDCWLLIQEMKRANYSPDTNIISLMILSLSSDGMTKSAFSLFQNAIADANNRDLTELYQAMIVGFKSRKDPENVNTLTIQMLKSDIDIPPTFFKHVLAYLFNCNHYDDATRIFLQLLKTNRNNTKLLEDSTIFVFMIKNLVLNHQYTNATRVLEQLFHNTISDSEKVNYPNEIISQIESENLPHYRQCLSTFYYYLIQNMSSASPSLITALEKHSTTMIPSLFMEKWEQTQNSVDLTKKSGKETLAFSNLYSSVKALISAGKLLEASSLIESSITSYKSDPYPVYNLLIKAYSNKLQEDKVHELISKMEKNQLSPNTITFELLYKLYKQTGNTSLSKKWYYIQKDTLQIPLSLKSYKYLMSLFSHHDPSFSRELLLDTIDSDTLPTSALINIALKPFVESSSYDLCDEFLNQLGSINIQFYHANFSYIIGSMAKHGALKEAENLLVTMQARFNLKPNTQICSALLKGYNISRDSSGTRRVFEFMIRNSIPLNQITYSILIQSAMLDENYTEVENLLKAMSNEGIKPNLITLSCLIGPHVGSQGIDGCNAFIDRLKDHQLAPDSKTHVLLLRSLSNMSNLDDCVKYFKTYWDSIIQSPEPYAFLLEIGTKNQDLMDGILSIHYDLVQSKKFQVTPTHFETLVRALIQWQRFEDLLKVIEEHKPFPDYSLPPYIQSVLSDSLYQENSPNDDLYNKLKSYL